MEAEDLALAVVEFASGGLGTIMASTSIQPGFAPALNLFGEKGTVKLEGATITHWTVPEVAKPDFGAAQASAGVSDPRIASHRHHKAQILDFLGAIEEGRPPAVTAEDGRRAVALVEAVYRSSSTGVRLELK
jgi:predicted dehydrogenase